MADAYARVKAWRAANPDKVAAQARRYRKKHPDVVAAIKNRSLELTRSERLPREAEKARQRRQADPVAQQRRNQAFLERKRAEQEQIAGRPRPQVCELCGERSTRIVFDHCHAKGHFRGWLCDRCNKTLGLVRDDLQLLRKMIGYLEERHE